MDEIEIEKQQRKIHKTEIWLYKKINNNDNF
jgi:hypothetical protein